MNHSLLAAQHRSGFTLLELSVVLAIIGLLVGGIASLRTYTRNATITTTINEGKILIDAYNQFQTRYQAVPGDFATASASWTGAGNGDGNGLIRAASVAVPLERYYAFQHLGLGGFIPGRYTGAANGAGGATIGLNVKGAAMDKVAFIFDHPDALDGFVSGDALYFDGQYGNILRIAGLNDNATNIPDQAFLNGKQALNVDEKYDDGRPGTGMIVTPKSAGLAGCASNDVSTAADYITTTNTKTCYLFVRIQ